MVRVHKEFGDVSFTIDDNNYLELTVSGSYTVKSLFPLSEQFVQELILKLNDEESTKIVVIDIIYALIKSIYSFNEVDEK